MLTDYVRWIQKIPILKRNICLENALESLFRHFKKTLGKALQRSSICKLIDLVMPSILIEVKHFSTFNCEKHFIKFNYVSFQAKHEDEIHKQFVE